MPRRSRKGGNDSDFRDTRPLREHQERLHAQRGKPQAHYRPNHVPAATRVLLCIVSLTWVGWALVGLLSGHMFFFLFGPIHFSGVPALVFCVAVLASAAACSVAVVDHYDRRDNEAAYRRSRKRLWWIALAAWALAAAVSAAEEFNLLPYTGGEVGLMSTERLNSLFAFEGLQRFMDIHHHNVHVWWWITAAWCVCGMLLLQKLGLLKDASTQPAFGVSMIAISTMVMPAVATLSLVFLEQLTALKPAQWAGHDEALRSQMAWLQSGLLTCVSLLGLMFAILVFGALREAGLVKSVPRRNPDASRPR